MAKANHDAEQLTEFGRCRGRQRISARRICPPRQRRRRIQALRDVVYNDSCSGHPRAGCGHLHRESLLARTAHPDQPELQALDGRRHPGCEWRSPSWLRRHLPREAVEPLSLYKHQEQAIALAAEGESFVVTTGTGSGKSPLLLHPHRQPCAGCTAHEREAKRTHAIVVYPMNALANSQMDELDQVHRPSAWRPADHVRPLHGAGRQE